MTDCIFFRNGVNGLSLGHVVGSSKEFFQMNRNEILSAWPEDERDRKRAPARF
jgi:hypothetical protein